MNAYSDLIFLMGAMIVFSLLSIQTSRLFQMNTQMQMEAEIQYNAISIAQDQIDTIRWITSETELNSYASSFPKQIPMTVEGETLNYTADVTLTDMSISGSSVSSKKVTVTVNSQYLPNDSAVTLTFIKSFNS